MIVLEIYADAFNDVRECYWDWEALRFYEGGEGPSRLPNTPFDYDWEGDEVARVIVEKGFGEWAEVMFAKSNALWPTLDVRDLDEAEIEILHGFASEIAPYGWTHYGEYGDRNEIWVLRVGHEL